MRDGFHVTREVFTHLSDLEWGAVGRMSSTVGNIGITAMLKSLDRDLLHAAIARFIQHEFDAERAKIALHHQQGYYQAEQLRELGAQ